MSLFWVAHSVAQRRDPAEVAESIISKFPGSSVAAKTSTALITGSIAAYLISKEIYILDGEIFEMACMFGAYAIWYVNGKEGAIEYFNGRKSVRSLFYHTLTKIDNQEYP